MNKITKTGPAIDILGRASEMQLLLTIMGGTDYGTKIASVLRKRQQVVARQLVELENAGLIVPLETNMSRKKGKKYAIAWDLFSNTFYKSARDKLRSEYFEEKSKLRHIADRDLESLIPKQLMIDYFEDCLAVIKDIHRIEIFRKQKQDLPSLIESMFLSLYLLELNDLKSFQALGKKYGLSSKHFEELSDLVGYWVEDIMANLGWVNLAGLANKS
jgi:uncharacterized protein YifN (PemK superfamily)